MSPNENPDPVSLILFEVVDQLAADLGPQDRRYPPDFWHLIWTDNLLYSTFAMFRYVFLCELQSYQESWS